MRWKNIAHLKGLREITMSEYIKLTKEFVIKEDGAFRLRVKRWNCLSPADLNAIEFTQECIGKDGNVDFSSTYQFFMTDKEIKSLIEGLSQ